MHISLFQHAGHKAIDRSSFYLDLSISDPHSAAIHFQRRQREHCSPEACVTTPPSRTANATAPRPREQGRRNYAPHSDGRPAQHRRRRPQRAHTQAPRPAQHHRRRPQRARTQAPRPALTITATVRGAGPPARAQPLAATAVTASIAGSRRSRAHSGAASASSRPAVGSRHCSTRHGRDQVRAREGEREKSICWNTFL
jgi:hypothetical protein